MSSLKNAISRRTHKERAQPAARKKFGLLEKHKDYVARAKDFHRKENTIKALKRKAEERNPDEFYFAMQKAKTKDGVHDGRRTVQNKYSQEQLMLMKTQDVKYLLLKERTETEKVKRLQASLHLIGMEPAEGLRKHTVFVDSAAEARALKPEEYFDTPAELLGRSHNRPRVRQMLVEGLPEASGPVASRRLKLIEKKKQSAYKELLERADRQGKVARTASLMAYEKATMGKGRKRKLKSSELSAEETSASQVATVYKWKRERKK
ncbi:hypothetical protein CEUSTIGMA_g8377.t1 [Chlamydomonas eustigma]|uniref:U3 small nucleolar RNA-associated protein 11 n=1 Tax=Chlamydomonas eustigma TaxID=1157962 RepID=A0A250XDI9_9CHLO|nr:hypothetical protein CEUSTIGMA_g8377.t1 [Chlamydomonas eustigma]|eukprot:GAX80942.1 hypothetical protein CEUSTIGMA_g8377.t1 [Chlamydomonas eustigma]